MSHAGAPVDEDEVIQSGDIASGDYVKVELDPEVFKAMHESNEEAGWDDLMMEVHNIPYSRKSWQPFNVAVWSQRYIMYWQI